MTKYHRFGNDITVKGNIILTGLVDGRDVETDGIKLDTIDFGAADNTASNVGVGGEGIFKQKVNLDLEFKHINTASTKLTLFDDITNDEVDVDIVPGNITIGNISGAPTGDVIGVDDTQILTNKTIIQPIISTISNTGILTLPTATDTLIGRITTDIFTNKTYTSPTMSTIVNTGILTLPTSADTLVSVNTTDTLTGKSINTISNTFIGFVKTDVELGNVANTLMNFTATTPPSELTDDITLGYTIGSRWIDVTDDKEYVLLDNTDGVAVWKRTVKVSLSGENIGNAGANIFKQLNDASLELKSINNKNGIILTNDIGLTRFDVSFDLNTLSTFVPDRATDYVLIYDTLTSTHHKILVDKMPSNTGSNVGTTGVSIFKQKVLATLQLKKINQLDAISVTDNVNIDIALDVNGLIDDLTPSGTGDLVMIYDTSASIHNKVLLNTLPKVTGSSVGTVGVNIFKQKVGATLQFKKINGATTISITDNTNELDFSININGLTVDTTPVSTDNYILFYDTSTSTHNKLLLSNIPDGEINTGSNIGSGLVSIFDVKTSVDFNFKSVNSVNTTSGIKITDNVVSDTVDFELDINSLTEDLTPNNATDFIITYDTSTSLNKKVLFSNLPSGESNTGSNIGTSGFGIFNALTGANFDLKNINTINGLSLIDDIPNDKIDIQIDLNNLILATNIDLVTDFVLVYDTTAGINKKVLLSSLPTAGAINTASNIGTFGVNVFKQKTGSVFELKKLNGTNPIILTNVTLNEIDISLNINGLTEELLPNSYTNYISYYSVADTTTKKVLLSNLTSGETNTVSNIGTVGFDFFKQKSVFDFEFKSLNTTVTTSCLKITDNLISNTIDIDLNINELTEKLIPDILTDYILSYDTSASDHKKILINNILSGETNTASNIGTIGIGLFKQKLLADLEFNSLLSDETIIITDDVGNNKIDISLNINGLSTNISPNKTTDFVVVYDDSATTNTKVLLTNLPDSGELNTASSVGTVGISVFKQKAGVNFEFKKIHTNTIKKGITITDDIVNDKIDINLDISGLDEVITPNGNSDFAVIYDGSTTEHKKILLNNLGSGITASNVGIGGIGLFKQKNNSILQFKNINVKNGILISNVSGDNVNIDIDINGLTEATIIDISSDYFVSYDTSTNSHKKVLLNLLPTAAGGEINTASSVGTGIEVFKQKTGTIFEFKKINSDTLTIFDNIGNNDIDISVNINGLTTLSTTDGNTDFLVIYDTSAAIHKKLLLNNIPSAAGEINTVSNIGTSGITMFKQKTGVDFEFKSIDSSSGIQITNNITEIDIGLDINSLVVDPTPSISDFIIVYDVSAATHKKTLLNNLLIIGGTEVNSVLNIGSGGVGVFKQKTSVDLEFKSINSNSCIKITDDVVNNELNISLDINSLTNDVTPDGNNDFLIIYDMSAMAHRKILLNNIPIVGGQINTALNIGLTVGSVGIFKSKVGVDIQFKSINSTPAEDGITIDLTNNIITATLDINSLTENVTPVTATDFVVTYDTSTNTHKKVLLNNLPTADVTNVGTTGIGLFKQKVGSVLEFKNLSSDVTNGIILTDDVANNKIDIELNINGLIEDTTPDLANDFVVYFDSATSLHKKVLLNNIPVVGEVNTVSSIGVGGISMFKQKALLDLEFKSLKSNNGIILTDDGANNKIDITLDINSLVIDTSPDANNDFIITYDTSTTEHKKVLISGLPSSEINTVSSVGVGGISVFKQKTGVNFEFKNIISTDSSILVSTDAFDNIELSLNINNLTVVTPDVLSDFVVIYDVSTTTHKKLLINNIPNGEDNTASTIGTSGINIFEQKVGVDLQFNKINSTNATSGILIVDNITNNEVDITLNINGLTTDATPDLAADYIITYDTSASLFKKVLLNVLPVGEINTVSNVGTGGISVFKQKTGADFEFKSINSTTGITIVDDGINDEIDVELNINSLTNDTTPDNDADYIVIYDTSALLHKKILLNQLPASEINTVSNIGSSGAGIFVQKVALDLQFKSINSTTLTVIDNVGNNDIDIGLDIVGFTIDGTPDGAADYTVIYDTSTAVHKKVLINNLTIGENNTASNVGTGSGIGLFKQKTGLDLEFKSINNSSVTDAILITDDTGNNEINISLNVNELTADTTPDTAADFVISYDTSASDHKKVLLNSLPIAAGGEANTASNIALVTVTSYAGILDIWQAFYLIESGNVYSSGHNNSGQLGSGRNQYGQTVDTAILEKIPDTAEFINGNISAVTQGATSGAFLTTDGTVYGVGAMFNWATTPKLIQNGGSYVNENTVSISMTFGTMLILKNDGTVWGLGNPGNSSGIPSGNTIIPVQVPVNGSIVFIATGTATGFIINSTGQLYATGYNYSGELGVGDTTLRDTFTDTGVSNAIYVDGGFAHSGMIKSDNKVYMAGINNSGQLGIGDLIQRRSFTLVPNSGAFVNENITIVSCGDHSTLFLNSSGQLFGTGSNTYGQLGLGNTTPQNTPVLITTNVAFASFKSKSTAYITTTNELYVTGYNRYGVLGLGHNINQLTPVLMTLTETLVPNISCTVDGISLFKQKVSLNLEFNNLNTLTNSGILLNDDLSNDAINVSLNINNLDLDSTPDVDADFILVYDTSASTHTKALLNVFPQIEVTTASNAIAISSSLYNDLATISNAFYLILGGNIYSSGFGTRGALGNGINANTNTLDKLPDSGAFTNGNVRLVTGSEVAGGLINTDDVIYVWGQGTNVALGLGTGQYVDFNTPQLQPTAGVYTNDNIHSISMGGDSGSGLHTMILKKDGTLFACGSGGNGQLGLNNIYISPNVPTQVTVSGTIIFIETGYYTSFIINSTGQLYSTGRNTNGQLGVGDITSRDTFTYTGVSNAIYVSGGFVHSGIIKSDNKVYMTGPNNHGQLGIGDLIQRTSYTLVPNSGVFVNENMTIVSSGSQNTLFLNSSGQLFGSGLNQYAQLGLGHTTQQNTPVLITTNVAFVSFKFNSTMYITTTNELYVMGQNTNGQLGLGNNTNQSTPVQVTLAEALVPSSVTYDSKTSVFKQKTGVNFEFKKLNGINGIEIIDDIGNDELDINLNINSLTTDADPDIAIDLALVYDTSATVFKKVVLTNLGGTTGINIGTGITLFKQKNGLTFEFKNLNTADSSITVVDNTSNNEISFDLSVNSLTEETTLDLTNDYIISYDISTTTNKKVSLQNLINTATIPYIEVTSITSVNTTSTTYVLITSMTSTPAVGTYLVNFSSTMNATAISQLISYAIFYNNTIVSSSERQILNTASHTNDFNVLTYTQAKITVDGVNSIEIKYKSSSANIVNVLARSLILIKI
jgi:alpha-tubulin suppressor-like RCC1 family protein